MTLVYLDSAHLALLDRASPGEKADFLDVWNAQDCELILSLHHLQEIGQLADVPSIDRRLAVLELFPTIRTHSSSSASVLELEIKAQLLALSGYSVDTNRSATAFFPLADLNAIRHSVLAHEPIFKQMREALEIGADAENLAKLARRHAADAKNSPEEQFVLDSEFNPDLTFKGVSEQLLSVLRIHLPQQAIAFQQLLDRYEQVDPASESREMLVQLYDLGAVTTLGRILDKDYATVCTFFTSAREIARSMAQIEAEGMVNRLDPYHCPGFALKLAVRRARASHPKPDVASDEVDVDHLMFAPYVDHMFVDKRTYGFVEQEAKRFPDRIPTFARRNIRKAGSLALVAQILSGAENVGG